MEEDEETQDDWITKLINEEDLEDELLEDEENESAIKEEIDLTKLRGEIRELESYLELAYSIKEDEKSHALAKALQTGFEKMAEMGSPRKAVIFTESVRTQNYLASYLERHGYAGRVVTFSGTNNS